MEAGVCKCDCVIVCERARSPQGGPLCGKAGACAGARSRQCCKPTTGDGIPSFTEVDGGRAVAGHAEAMRTLVPGDCGCHGHTHGCIEACDNGLLSDPEASQ